MSTNVPAKAAPVSVATDEPKKLDDVLLAMDVVDTIRHRERIVDAELNAEQRESQLIERLKQIYVAQGIEVPERILKDGVKALEEQRFVYKPPRAGFNTSLAKLYISRRRWLPATLMLIVAAVIAGGITAFSIQAGEAEWRGVSTQIAAVSAEAQKAAVDPAVDRQIESVAREGQRAVADNHRGEAKAALATLKTMNTQLSEEYDVRIVSRPGEDTGFYRIPDDQPFGRNYYIIVEAVAPGGRVVSVPIANEENQKPEMVSKWAQRVSQEEFNKVSEDKRNNQIVEDDILGHKALGELKPAFNAGVETGAITKW